MYLSKQSHDLLSHYLSSDLVSAGSLDFIACHGFITALVVRDDFEDIGSMLKLIVDDEPRFQSESEKTSIEGAMNELYKAISRALYLGDELDLPFKLTPPKQSQTNDLTDWCFGFMEAIAIFEDDWFASGFPEQSIAELLLPISIFSEPHVEPELAHLVKTDQARNSLAAEIPENLQQLYLLFRD